MSDRLRFDNYELLRHPDGALFELGRGSMGVTYKARDTDLHCDVALKVNHRFRRFSQRRVAVEERGICAICGLPGQSLTPTALR